MLMMNTVVAMATTPNVSMFQMSLSATSGCLVRIVNTQNTATSAPIRTDSLTGRS